MAEEATYTEARANLAALCDEVAESREVLIIHRRGAKDVALVAAVNSKPLRKRRI
jgi:antitoxin YefM